MTQPGRGWGIMVVTGCLGNAVEILCSDSGTPVNTGTGLAMISPQLRAFLRPLRGALSVSS